MDGMSYGLLPLALPYCIVNAAAVTITVPNNIPFDTIVENKGITYDTSTGIFTLIGGYTYRLWSGLWSTSTTEGGRFGACQWVFSSDNSPVSGGQNGMGFSNWLVTSGDASINEMIADTVYTATTNIGVALRYIFLDTGNAQMTTSSASSSAHIHAISQVP